MTLWAQIFAGSLVLALCALIHVALLTAGVDFLTHLTMFTGDGASAIKTGTFILAGFGIVVLGHTVQIWVWAFVLLRIGALRQIENAVYFALVTTTTLGYGDVTLSSAHRIFGAMAAVSGLLNFGLSTAYLINLVGGLMSERI